jgi:uncharacterized membrane protein
MSKPRFALSDQQMDDFIGIILRVGVALAALVVLVGGVLYLHRYGNTFPDYRVFHGEPSDLRSVGGILRDVPVFRSRGIIQCGLLLLVATPLVRVAFAVVAFALQRDRTYVTVTLIVLSVLLYSLLGASH